MAVVAILFAYRTLERITNRPLKKIAYIVLIAGA
jgi:hypothetical protein